MIIALFHDARSIGCLHQTAFDFSLGGHGFMVEINHWMEEFIKQIQNYFQDRIICIGLQGSYARGEANENSDIDVVVIFDTLSMQDLKQYDKLISTMKNRELICGFLSGIEELLQWKPADLFQFYHDTKIYYGNLDVLLPCIGQETAYQAFHSGACDIYHACCHNILHEKDIQLLKALYKQAVFVLQAKLYYETSQYVSKHKDLFYSLNGRDQEILDHHLSFQMSDASDMFDQRSESLLEWSKELIKYNIAV